MNFEVIFQEIITLEPLIRFYDIKIEVFLLSSPNNIKIKTFEFDFIFPSLEEVVFSPLIHDHKKIGK